MQPVFVAGNTNTRSIAFAGVEPARDVSYCPAMAGERSTCSSAPTEPLVHDAGETAEPVARAAASRGSETFVIEPQVFADYAAARLSPGARGAAQAEHHGADLYLACGCALGLPGAVAMFEAMLRSEIAVAFQHLRLQPSAIDDVCQMAREKVIVGGPGRAPRIAEYSGRGSLRGWTRVVVTRIALNLLRDRKREVPLEEALLDLQATDTYHPELSCLQARFGGSVRSALDHAMRSITADERVLLRQRFVDGLTTAQIATLYHKHRITMLRRLNSILRTVRIRTEQFLERDVGCGRSTAVSIVNQALGHSHLSVLRHLLPPD